MTRRYAVRFPDGQFSSGPRREAVPLEKAKLWRTRGQVCQHLQCSTWHAKDYPPGTEIVSVDVTLTVGAEAEDVDTYMDAHRARKARAAAEDERRTAEATIRRAKQDLREAKERLARL